MRWAYASLQVKVVMLRSFRARRQNRSGVLKTAFVPLPATDSGRRLSSVLFIACMALLVACGLYKSVGVQWSN